MKKIFLSSVILILTVLHANSQCSLTNATSCQCLQSGSTDCDLLPDIKVARPPLLVSGSGGIIEYSQSGNGSNDGLLRISVSTPNIGRGPLEIRATNVYVCGTDTFIGTPPGICPDGISFPKNLITQRVYHKNGNVMSYYDRPAGTMTYHPQHGHMHVDNWGEYSLRKATTDPNPLSWPIYATGAKLAFCLMDYGTCSYYNGHCVNSNGQTLTNDSFPNFGLGGGSYSCSSVVQGISSGFTDIYYQNLDGMWVDLPDSICNGDYFIVVNLDPYNYFLESEETNNLMAVPITLIKQQGTVPTVTANGPTTFCQGSSVTLTSSVATNYLWSNGATTQSTVITNTGTYSVTVNTTSTCPSSSAPVQVTTSALNVTATATPASLCEQGQAQLSSTLSGDSLTLTNVTFSNNNQYFITDNNATGVQSPIAVSGINPSTLNASTYIKVQMHITHTYDADLILYLISPSGNQIMLSNKRGGNGNDFINTIFSTNATTLISAGTAPFNGTFVPDQAFINLTGNVNGNWILRAADVANQDTGRIQSWSIQFSTLSPSTHNYSWTSDPAGFSSTITNPVANLTQTTTYTVTVTNPVSGCAGSATVTVPVNALPVVSFTGLDTLYQSTSTASTLTGSPTGGTFSGTGVSGNTFDPAVAGIGGPYTITYSYTDANGCSNSTSSETSVICTLPVKPGTIKSIGGVVKMCPGDTKSYSIVAIAGASSYLWTPPAGGTITTGQGTNAVTINYTSGFTVPDSIKVAAVNGCGTGDYKALKINRNKPVQPSVITGDSTGVCNGTGVPYSVANVAGMTYNWTNTSTNASIASGQGTSAVTVDFIPPYKTGTLKVTANNGCGASMGRALFIKAVPAIPGDITGPTTVCANQAGVPYSIAPVAAAATYTWIGPSGSHTSDGVVTSAGAKLITTATNVTVNYGATAGIYKVRADNACGSSLYKSITVSFNCREINGAADMDVMLFPNPADDDLTVSFNGDNESPYSIKLNDILGKTLLTRNGISDKGSNSFNFSLHEIVAGVYLVEIKVGDESRVLKLVVN